MVHHSDLINNDDRTIDSMCFFLLLLYFQWKERGVGQFKVLYHPGNESYRLLLRREQIHKLVLNMALSPILKIQQMKQNDKAYTWIGQNFAEKGDGELESLSVRFKTAEIASQFYSTVQQCIEKLKAREN